MGRLQKSGWAYDLHSSLGEHLGLCFLLEAAKGAVWLAGWLAGRLWAAPFVALPLSGVTYRRAASLRCRAFTASWPSGRERCFAARRVAMGGSLALQHRGKHLSLFAPSIYGLADSSIFASVH